MNPLFSPSGDLLGGLFKRVGGGGAGLFDLAKTMVLVLHRGPKYKVEKFKYNKYKKLEGMHPKIKNKSKLQTGE